MVRSPFAVGKNAVSIVRSIGVETKPKPSVVAELDGGAVLEALDVSGGRGSDRLKSLQEAAGEIRKAKAELSRLETAAVVGGDEETRQESIRRWRRQLERWQGLMVKVLVVMLLERGGLIG